ncbi:Uncharacterized protein TPAR_02263 [Tolypocladium paradoxum]|uniref:Uncharacterized protein n=1 Tax=Tolypocladium paradoxum TaxID=94208 RepID=A0A2S4L517_9HYPO|nr:Uncharacterized protein TPAR_02263 [Tolypocladium paradoxum]
MDFHRSGSYVHGNDQVARIDPPFGFMSIEDWKSQYALTSTIRGITGFMLDGLGSLIMGLRYWMNIESWLGFESEAHLSLPQGIIPTPGYVPDHIASERAVCDIFRWAATEIEVTGANIYTHPWVDALLDLDMDDDDETDSGSDGGLSSSDWLL